MNLNIDQLRKEVESTLRLIEVAESKACQEANAMGIDVMDMRTSDRKWVMNELLASKIKAYNSLVMIEFLDLRNKS